MRKIFFGSKIIIHFCILFLLTGCVYKTYQSSSSTRKVEVPQTDAPVFFLKDPTIRQDPNFHGSYERENNRNGRWVMEHESSYASVKDRPIGSMMSVDALPGLKNINQRAVTEYPTLFAKEPGQALPLVCDVSLTRLTSSEVLRFYPSLTTDQLSWTVTLGYEDLDKKVIPVGRSEFSMSYQAAGDFFVAPSLGAFPFAGRSMKVERSSGSGRSVATGYTHVYNAILSASIIDCAAEIINTHKRLLIKQAKMRSKTIDEEKIDKHWALVIGISQYQHSDGGLTSLAFADQDAEAMTDIFYKRMNWPKSRIRTLTNASATKSNILETLTQITSQMKDRDLLTVYWSGHGFSREEQAYFACHDTNATRPESAISMPELRDLLDTQKVRNVLFIADTCHAGGIATGMRGLNVEAYQGALKPEAEKKGGWIFMLAAEADRQAVEDKSWGHGAFTYCLLRGLSGEADGYEGSGNKDAIITPAELKSYLSARVPLETQNALGSAIHPLINTNSANPKIWEINIYEKQD